MTDHEFSRIARKAPKYFRLPSGSPLACGSSPVGNRGLSFFNPREQTEGVVSFRAAGGDRRRGRSGGRHPGSLLPTRPHDRHRRCYESVAERGTGEAWWRLMPPLGRALMGLWASEAYSFRPVSTSRFPSILFHNTPGDVYVLQDARKMRSRLHSDIGKFTAGWKERRERERGREERRGRRTTQRREIGLGFARASRLLFASAIHRILRMRRQARFRLRTLTSPMRNSIHTPGGAVQPGIGRCVLTWNRKGNKLFENCPTLNIDERLDICARAPDDPKRYIE